MSDTDLVARLEAAQVRLRDSYLPTATDDDRLSSVYAVLDEAIAALTAQAQEIARLNGLLSALRFAHGATVVPLGTAAPAGEGKGRGQPAVRVWVAGRPIAQGSLRSVGRGRMLHANPALHAWRDAIAWTVRATVGAAVLDPATRVRVRCHFFVRPRRKGDGPDLDKLVRAVLDALTHVLYVDDKQVAQIEAARTLGAGPEGLALTVEDDAAGVEEETPP